MSREDRDLRVFKTEAALKAALVELAAAGSFEAITVESITALAMVNRATFYRHYRDKYALAERIVEEAVDGMLDRIAAMFPSPFACDADPASLEVPRPFVELFEYIGRNQRLFRAIIDCGELPGIREKLRLHLEARIRERLETWREVFTEWRKAEGAALPFDVSSSFCAAFFLGAVARWLEAGAASPSPRDMAAWTRSFIFAGCRG